MECINCNITFDLAFPLSITQTCSCLTQRTGCGGLWEAETQTRLCPSPSERSAEWTSSWSSGSRAPRGTVWAGPSRLCSAQTPAGWRCSSTAPSASPEAWPGQPKPERRARHWHVPWLLAARTKCVWKRPLCWIELKNIAGHKKKKRIFLSGLWV